MKKTRINTRRTSCDRVGRLEPSGSCGGSVNAVYQSDFIPGQVGEN
jgi:hypothetical protein